MSREKMRKAKARFEIQLAKDVKSNEKGFCKYVKYMRKTRKM